MDEVRITLPSGKSRVVSSSARISELLDSEPEISGTQENPLVAVNVNNEVLDLTRRVLTNAQISPVYLASDAGVRCYRRALCFLLAMASKELFPQRRLIIGHSIGDAYFYYYHGMDQVSAQDIDSLIERMRELVRRDLPVSRGVISYADALELFGSQQMEDTAILLQHHNNSQVAVHTCGGFLDLSHGPVVPRTGILRHFDISRLDPGFVLRFPSRAKPTTIHPYHHSELLFTIYQEYKSWGQILGVTSAGRLNDVITSDRVGQFISVSEALQEKKITQIADRIADRSDDVKVVLIAGPSSSGKTTFTKRLAIQLTVLGMQPVQISLDDYFLDREHTPRDDEGTFDFESIHALDIDLINDHLNAVFDYQEVELPAFDFKTGTRVASGRHLRLNERGILLMEGIHGLNDELTPRIDHKRKYKVYVSALTQLNLDDHNRIPTTDNRLLRRLVRDYQFRGHSALDTLGMWPSVRRGEARNIFPYQETADAAFNSALDYELGVLKKHVEPLLQHVKPYHNVYNEAVRMRRFLSNFINIPDKLVPDFSILREFIGDSGFHY
jgi:uridine kinase